MKKHSAVLRAGVCGLGRIGRGSHGPDMASYPDCFDVCACADHDASRLENLPPCFDHARKYSSLEEMLKDDSLDLITIATRHQDHVPMALKIVEAGKIAVVEKPSACSLQEFQLLKQWAKQYPDKIFIRHNRRFESPFQKALTLMRSGILGKVSYIKLYRSVGYQRRNDWMTMTEFYGGLLSNWGPHLIDQALQFLEAPVVDLWADVRHSICIGDGDDQLKLILKAENGRLADIELSGANTMPGREMEIVGTRGTLVYDGGNKIHVRMVDPSIEFKELKPHPENPPLAYGNFEETLSFVDADYDIPSIPFSIIWEKIYNSAVNGEPYPITWEQAEEVVRITENAFIKSHFTPMLQIMEKS